MVVMLARLGLPGVLRRFFIKCLFASGGTKIIGLSIVLRLDSSCLRVDIHSTNGIFNHPKPPVLVFKFGFAKKNISNRAENNNDENARFCIRKFAYSKQIAGSITVHGVIGPFTELSINAYA